MPTTPQAQGRALIDFDGNRENNFTVLRMTLAWLVLYGHSFPIVRAPGVRDPLNQIFQGSIWIGELAVNGFFAISGFLVAASLIRRGVVDYPSSRGLRIFPALILCVLAMVCVLGPLMTSLDLGTYLQHPRTLSYLYNAAAFFQMQFDLPGVFKELPMSGVNGSLWSLTAEVRCYLLLAAAGLLHLVHYRGLANLLLVAAIVLGFYHYSDLPLLGFNARFGRPALFFAVGVLFYLNRDKIILDGRLALAAAFATFYSFGTPWSQYVFPAAFTYLLFYLAYRTPHMDLDSRLGDLSYGIYIYAWPVQQLVRMYLPHEGPYMNTLVSTPIVFALAWLSWHWVEKPVLARKQDVMATVHRLKTRMLPGSNQQ